MSPSDRVDSIRAAMPSGGMFRDREWVLSPEAFPLDAATLELIVKLGPGLRAFQRACNTLYHASAIGEAPPWIADLLDMGKPEEMVRLGRHPRWRDELPRVIRPDLVLTETGVTIAEIDSLPGGIGLTAWLNETYAGFDGRIVGEADGMIRGFAAAFPVESILISAESADYEPEMQWLVNRLNDLQPGASRGVIRSRDVSPQDVRGGSIYRFFELFDLENVENSGALLKMAQVGELDLTPPLKPQLEEKLWLALFWAPQLRTWWQTLLGREIFALLERCIPRGWVVNPAPLPPYAVYPHLNINSWEEARAFGGKQRRLALKISGFSPRGWGSRGVFIGHDLSQEQWSAALDEALESFPANPFLLQEFHAGRVVQHPAWRESEGGVVPMKARVRLCPYYFVPTGTEEVLLGGVLATVCPADKKLLHGMRDAMMLPCRQP